MVFQSYAVWPHLSVYDNIAFPLKLQKVHKTEIEKKGKTCGRNDKNSGISGKIPTPAFRRSETARGTCQEHLL